MATKARIFSNLEPKVLARFGSPASKLRRAFANDQFNPIPPTSIPPGEDEQLQERFLAWEAQYPAGSLPEFLAWEYLTIKRKQRLGIDFFYQASVFGGRTQFGGFVLDFAFPKKGTGWMIQGLRYHLLNPNDRAKNAIAKVMMRGRGIKLLELWEDDILTRPDFVFDAAFYRDAEVGRRAVL